MTTEENIPQKYYHAVFDATVAGITCLVSTTGYTGEDGVELYLKSEDAVAMWQALLENGKEEGLIPCGLGARDTLRMEVGMPLYGHEMNEEITPLEAGLRFAVKLKKDDFIGKKAMVEMGDLKRQRVGLKVTGKGIVREQSEVFRRSTDWCYYIWNPLPIFTTSICNGINSVGIQRDRYKCTGFGSWQND